MNFILTKHAQNEIRKRRISIELVRLVLENPEQVVEERVLNVYQSLIEIGGKTWLLRVVANDRTNPVIVVTVYSTTQIKRYWRN